jgi:integrase
LHYFGYWRNADGSIKPDGGDWKTALELYKSQADDLHAGRTPRTDPDAVDVADLVDRFLTSKRLRLDSGELSARTFRDYYKICEKLVRLLGKRRLVDDLRSDDFERMRAELAKGVGPVTLSNDIGRIRSVFKYAYDADLTDKPVRFGTSFDKPSKKTLRLERAKSGTRMFEAEELRRIFDAVPQPLKAMVLLGINCGFGNTDVATLPKSAVDLERGWVTFPRPKTGIERKCPLWPETIEALREVIAQRPDPLERADADYVFLTRFGRRFVRMTDEDDPGQRRALDAIVGQFRKVLRKLDINGKRNFYAIRHTFQTVAEESRDLPAVKSIMGHADNSMSAVYRERISDERLQVVTAAVHEWLWPAKQEASDQ